MATEPKTELAEQLETWLRLNGKTQKEFGQMMNPPIGQAAVNHWFRKGFVPWRRVAALHELTGIPCHILNGHVHPKPPELDPWDFNTLSESG